MKNNFKRVGFKKSEVESSANQQPPGKKELGAIESLAVLIWGKDSNYSVFKEKLSTYALREYRDIGRIIIDNVYKEFPDVDFDPDNLSKANDPFGFHKEEVKSLMKIRLNELKEYEERKAPLYAVIWGQLSANSKEQISHDKNFMQIETDLDPLELWKLVTANHIVVKSGTNVVDQENASDNYFTISQYPQETITEYKKRFDHSLDAMDALGCEEVSQVRQASHFISKLDNQRYATFKASLNNNVMMNLQQYSNTLLDAFDMASRFTVVITKLAGGGTSGQGAVFTVSADTIRQRKKKQTKPTIAQDDSNTSSVESVSENEKSEQKKKFGGNCFICGAQGHRASECLKRFDKSGKSNDAKPSTNEEPANDK